MAASVWERIREEGKIDALERLLEDTYPDEEVIDWGRLNDLLWFDGEWLFNQLGIEEENGYDEDCEEREEIRNASWLNDQYYEEEEVPFIDFEGAAR